LKRVAIIAPDFTPSSLPPATRVRLFARHLREFGWEPVIITTRPEFYEARVDHENESLLPRSLEVIRTSAFSANWTRKIGIGDVGMRSLWHHWRALRRLCRERKVDATFIPVPPYVSMILGRLAHARFGIPYVIDYIDPWVTEFYRQLPKEQRPPKWRLAYWLARVLEPFALKRVAHITGVSRGTTDSVVRRYPRLSEEDATEIPYGAEASDFDYVRQHPRPNSIFDKYDGLIHLSYIGACPPPMHATVRALFAAMGLGLKREPNDFRRLRFHFVGTSYAADGDADCEAMRMAREAGVADYVTEQPRRISYLDSLQVMLDSQALVLIGSDEPHYTASKVFPYILARRPLLAIIHEESSVTKVLFEANTCQPVTFNSTAGPAERLDEISCQLKRVLCSLPDEPKTDWLAYEAYTSRAMAARVAQVFDRVVAAESDEKDRVNVPVHAE
jgi:hypothetical protein